MEAELLAPIELLQPIETLKIESLTLNQTAAVGEKNALGADRKNTKPAANTVVKAKKATINTQVKNTMSGSKTRGCYLTFDTVSEGTLFITWSETMVEGALGFMEPTKAVPAFKFKRAGGKTELIRNLRGGTGKGLKRYYEGWAQFAKLVVEYQGNLTLFESSAGNCLMYRLSADNKVYKVKTSLRLGYKEFAAVTIVAPDSTAFEGVATMTRDYFAGTGNREGAALLF